MTSLVDCTTLKKSEKNCAYSNRLLKSPVFNYPGTVKTMINANPYYADNGISSTNCYNNALLRTTQLPLVAFIKR